MEITLSNKRERKKVSYLKNGDLFITCNSIVPILYMKIQDGSLSECDNNYVKFVNLSTGLIGNTHKEEFVEVISGKFIEE